MDNPMVLPGAAALLALLGGFAFYRTRQKKKPKKAPVRAEGAKTPPVKPDVLFVLLDDLRWDALGYMDHPYVKTPNIDALARQRSAASVQPG